MSYHLFHNLVMLAFLLPLLGAWGAMLKGRQALGMGLAAAGFGPFAACLVAAATGWDLYGEACNQLFCLLFR